jgi:hypothetical protein
MARREGLKACSQINPRPSGSKNHPRVRNNAGLRLSGRREPHCATHSGPEHGPTALYGPFFQPQKQP